MKFHVFIKKGLFLCMRIGIMEQCRISATLMLEICIDIHYIIYILSRIIVSLIIGVSVYYFVFSKENWSLARNLIPRERCRLYIELL